MKLVLKGYSQMVDLSDPTKVKNLLVFDVDDGRREIPLPVPEETIGELMRQVYNDPVVKTSAAQEGSDEEPMVHGRRCSNCGYPDTFDGQHFKGIYTPGEICDHCGFDDSIPKGEEEEEGPPDDEYKGEEFGAEEEGQGPQSDEDIPPL